MPPLVDPPDGVKFDVNHLFLKCQSVKTRQVRWFYPERQTGQASGWAAPASYGVSVEGLEIEALVGDADVSWVTHQREDHLCGTLQVRPLTHALKASQHSRRRIRQI